MEDTGEISQEIADCESRAMAVMLHAKECKIINCLICKGVNDWSDWHSKHCQETKCPMPFCLDLKKIAQIKHNSVQVGVELPLVMSNAGPSTSSQQTSDAMVDPGNDGNNAMMIHTTIDDFAGGEQRQLSYQLHDQEQDKFVYTCNSCKSNVETRFHCTVCDDFDLCVKCYNKEGHHHKMQRLGFELGDDSAGGDQKQSNPTESRKLAIQRCISILEHACRCRDANCCLTGCRKMKKIVSHAKTCNRKRNDSCAICKQLVALTTCHAKNCQETKCPLLFCTCIKYKMKQRQMVPNSQQQLLLKFLKLRIGPPKTME